MWLYMPSATHCSERPLLRDIGYHFPDTDPAYKGADSRRLLREVARLLADKGYAVGNVDLTIMAQAPKMPAHIPVMISNIADDLPG